MNVKRSVLHTRKICGHLAPVSGFWDNCLTISYNLYDNVELGTIAERIRHMRLLQSLTRGLDTLDYMSFRGEPVRLTDLAGALGIEKSKAAHILKTLLAAGYAEQDASRRYRLTGKISSNARTEHSLEEI